MHHHLWDETATAKAAFSGLGSDLDNDAVLVHSERMSTCILEEEQDGFAETQLRVAEDLEYTMGKEGTSAFQAYEEYDYGPDGPPIEDLQGWARAFMCGCIYIDPRTPYIGMCNLDFGFKQNRPLPRGGNMTPTLSGGTPHKLFHLGEGEDYL